jgi:hypothetical protein
VKRFCGFVEFERTRAAGKGGFLLTDYDVLAFDELIQNGVWELMAMAAPHMTTGSDFA